MMNEPVANLASPAPVEPGDRLLVIGLGNECISDDGVGIRIVRELRSSHFLLLPQVVWDETSVGGLPLLDHLQGYSRCVIVDAVVSNIAPPGTLFRFSQHTASEMVGVRTSHQLDLSQVLRLGALLSIPLPHQITVYGIEACDVTTFSELCTPEVAAHMPAIIDIIASDIITREDIQHPAPVITGDAGVLPRWDILYRPVFNGHNSEEYICQDQMGTFPAS